MMFSDLAIAAAGQMVQLVRDLSINTLVTDSRKAIVSANSLFFAIRGERNNGHDYIHELYNAGIVQFVVEQDAVYSDYPKANFFRVESAVETLQSVATAHRNQFHIPVVGITGSNGKTIIKEWLYQLMAQDFHIVKNPGSYNSQTGVPLSVWQINEHHQLGIFEAGISRPGEMANLARIIKPTLGIFTNIGTAHDEGFKHEHEKIHEKLALFQLSEKIIYCRDHQDVDAEIRKLYDDGRLLSWGSDPSSTIGIKKSGTSAIEVTWKNKKVVIQLPFSDSASMENASHCVALMLQLNYSTEIIQERILKLLTVPMRLELKQGINGCQIIDDTYNNDLGGLQISLDFLSGIQTKKSVVILSDILQSGESPDALAVKIGELMRTAGVGLLIAIGRELGNESRILSALISCQFYPTAAAFLETADFNQFNNEVILVKGARSFRFESIVHRLVRKIHGTVMEVDLGALVFNLNTIKSGLKDGVKIMAMVKAFAYGSGSEEVANLLQYHKIDYLGVAYPDEGVELRKNKIRLPIMVMNSSEESFESMFANSLEPEIYNLSQLRSFASFLNGRAYRIHLKLDTGMHRLGLDEEDLEQAIVILASNRFIEIASVFSHLAGADDETHDSFTHEQASKFLVFSGLLRARLGIKPVLHLLNSSGILRFPQYQFGMVRLGISLYGINPTTEKKPVLKPVATLKTVISQIKKIGKGETIGYGRKGKAEHDMTLATLAIGYADGFSRAFSGGKGQVLINGMRAPVIGNVCMDMTMVDISGIDTHEGDEVIIFGKGLPITEIAAKINTIPYEILTGTSERVKRVFYAESI